MRYIKYYLFDIIPFLLIIALIIVGIRYYKCKKSGEFSFKREILFLIFYIYISAMFLKTCVPVDYLHLNFSSLKFMLPDKDYIFNNPYQSYIYIRAYIIEHRWFELINVFVVNLVMLVPFGFLFPILYPNKKEYTIILGVAISCLIEFIQLFLPRLTDTFDIFLNALGVIGGYMLYKVVTYIKNRKNSPRVL